MLQMFMKITPNIYAIKYITFSMKKKWLVQNVNGPTINPKNSHKDLKSVLKITFTMLQKYIKIIPVVYAMKYITLHIEITKAL